MQYMYLTYVLSQPGMVQAAVSEASQIDDASRAASSVTTDNIKYDECKRYSYREMLLALSEFVSIDADTQYCPASAL